jgi:hypothetical protein
MGNFLFFVICIGIWAVFGWALVARPAMLDEAWAGVQGLPVALKPFVWIAFLPWLSGLAIWESGWRTAHARRLGVLVVAAAFICFWALITFPEAGGGG